ncbi:MAG: hypothetical protein LBQ94_05710 [Treponema sp.]|jgi:flagellar motor switch protein FliG|nr:hypothetical protein [Treponema sp.]
MGAGRDIVVTVYGHDRTIDKIAVSSFDAPANRYDYNGSRVDSDAATYCDTLNSLDLNGDSWVFAKIVSENTQYALDSFLPMKIDLLMKLHDRSLERVLRAVDSQDIAVVLKGESEELKNKVFSNMSERMAKMVKEDLEIMGQLQEFVVKKSRERIIDIIRQLELTGEIVIP